VFFLRIDTNTVLNSRLEIAYQAYNTLIINHLIFSLTQKQQLPHLAGQGPHLSKYGEQSRINLFKMEAYTVIAIFSGLYLLCFYAVGKDIIFER